MSRQTEVGTTIVWYHSGKGIPEAKSSFQITSPFWLRFYTDSRATSSGYALYLQPCTYGIYVCFIKSLMNLMHTVNRNHIFLRS